MSIFLATILAISATNGESTNATGNSPAREAAAAPVRTGRDLSNAAHAALQHWAKATDQEAAAAARELLGIYREIQKDNVMSRSERETLRITVRGRLDRLCTQIGKQIAKTKSDSKADTPVNSVASNPNQPRAAILAGVGVPAGGGFGGGAGPAAGQNANADNGQQLVDLIQNTISTKSWDVNGGACSIYYWQPQHAIVVRATGDVHDNIADTLEQLNRATH